MTMVVGYGTLLSRHSLQSTIGGNEADVMRCLSVTVPGWRRLYNLRAAHYTPSCVLGTPGVEASAANVEPAPGCAFNGLMFEVNAAQLASLDARERCYRRIEVEMFDFLTGSIFKISTMLLVFFRLFAVIYALPFGCLRR